MKIASLLGDIEYKTDRPNVHVLLETDVSKEIRIVFKKGQKMKDHRAPFPIVVEIFEGSINFGVNGEVMTLNRGALISLGKDVPHELTALEDSIVRLSLSKDDKTTRVSEVAEDT